MSGSNESCSRFPARIQLEVNLGAVAGNFKKIAARVLPSRPFCILKADAYGLGADGIAPTLTEAGAAGFGVATPSEANVLIKYRRPVIVLSSILPDEVPAMIEAGVELPICDLDAAKKINETAKKLKRRAKAHLKIDTGMGRLGMTAQQALDNAMSYLSLPWLDISAIASHFPCADDPSDPVNMRQIESFRELIWKLESAGFSFAERHIAASAALFNLPQSYRDPFNLVRVGLGLYGADGSLQSEDCSIAPVATLKAKVVQVRHIKAGASIGYSGTYTATDNMRIAVIAAGYADGVPLAISNRGHVVIAGRPCPVLGRVSMDCMTVSLDSIDGPVAVGTDAVLFGGEGEAMRIGDWAKLKNTHAYDILCSIGNRVERYYTK
jgi:alanine racemase